VLAMAIFFVTYLGFALTRNVAFIGVLFLLYGLYQGIFRAIGKALAGDYVPESLLSSVDLLFTDVGLPNGMNGRQLAEKARQRRPELRVLFTTGYARNAIVHQGRLDPGVELIVKPFTHSRLAAQVRRVLDAAGAVGVTSS
jgi:CheY-like chemotaxis protein